MRVLLTSSTFPLAEEDGIPRFVLDLASELSRRCEVSALVPASPGVQDVETMQGVLVRRFAYFYPRRLQALAYGRGMRENLRASWLARLQVPFFLSTQLAALHRCLTQQMFDVVNSHWLVPQGLTAALLRRRAPTFRHVLSVHAADVYLLEKLPSGRAIARFVVDRSDHVFADGSHVRDRLDRLLFAPSKATLRPMGVRSDLFDSSQQPPSELHFPKGYLVAVGRLVEKKGFKYLLRAMRRVLERHPGLRLVIIGAGPLSTSLRQEATALGVARAVRFVGRRSHRYVAAAMSGSRAVIVPSIVDANGEADGMPTVVVEALASGSIVIGSAVDGIPDLISPCNNGWLCPPRDADALAATILEALDDPNAAALRAAAARSGEAHDWKRVADEYLEAFTN